jgi:hypothetical protein
MDGAKSPVVGEVWKMEALELEEKMTATKITLKDSRAKR